jgi:hypothetical protein
VDTWEKEELEEKSEKRRMKREKQSIGLSFMG